MRASGVMGTIAVQARQTTEETAWLLDLAARHPSILGVVGWVSLADPDAGNDLERFVQQPELKARVTSCTMNPMISTCRATISTAASACSEALDWPMTS
jgi:predicted TIM-barrel fold metal-dependent hydrolase